MARLRYRLVDVFTEVPLHGNPLCVVLDPCPEHLMQAIAREVNLSETTFPVQTGEDSYEMRIFTPTDEVTFAGHPTLGTAWSLGPNRWTQVTRGATVTVDADENGARSTQPIPVFEPVEDGQDEILRALGLKGAEEIVRADVGGLVHTLVATSESIGALEFDLPAIGEATRRCGSHTLAPMHALEHDRLEARVSAPVYGLNEDPGSGSVAGPVALVARRLWGTDEHVTIEMGAAIRRPSQIEVDISREILVGGRVVISAEGEFLI